MLRSIAKLPSQQADCPLIFISLLVFGQKACIFCNFILVSFWLPKVLLSWFSLLTNSPWLQISCLFSSFNDWQTSLPCSIWGLEQTSLSFYWLWASGIYGHWVSFWTLNRHLSSSIWGLWASGRCHHCAWSWVTGYHVTTLSGYLSIFLGD